MPNQPPTPQSFVTLAFAARQASIPIVQVRRLVNGGLVTVRKLPGSPRRVLLDDVMRVLDEFTTTAGHVGGDS
jgi:hypothetical protein